MSCTQKSSSTGEWISNAHASTVFDQDHAKHLGVFSGIRLLAAWEGGGWICTKTLKATYMVLTCIHALSRVYHSVCRAQVPLDPQNCRRQFWTAPRVRQSASPPWPTSLMCTWGGRHIAVAYFCSQFLDCRVDDIAMRTQWIGSPVTQTTSVVSVVFRFPSLQWGNTSATAFWWVHSMR